MSGRDEALRDALKKSEEATQNTFDSWLGDLEEKDQPEACSIDSEDCEACGS